MSVILQTDSGAVRRETNLRKVTKWVRGVTIESWCGWEVQSHTGKPGGRTFQARLGGAGRVSCKQHAVLERKADLVCMFGGSSFSFRIVDFQPEEGAREGGEKREFWGGSSFSRQHCFGWVAGVGESEGQPRGSYSKSRMWMKSLSQNVNVKQLFHVQQQQRWFSPCSLLVSLYASLLIQEQWPLTYWV